MEKANDHHGRIFDYSDEGLTEILNLAHRKVVNELGTASIETKDFPRATLKQALVAIKIALLSRSQFEIMEGVELNLYSEAEILKAIEKELLLFTSSDVDKERFYLLMGVFTSALKRINQLEPNECSRNIDQNP